MLERMKHDKTIDIYGHVTCLRAQRNYVVQTEDQYIFIHDALAEAVLSGNTEVVASDLLNHIQLLSQPEPGEVVTGKTGGYTLRFRVVTQTNTNHKTIQSYKKYISGLLISSSDVIICNPMIHIRKTAETLKLIGEKLYCR